MKAGPRIRSLIQVALLSLPAVAALAVTGCGDDPAVTNGEPDKTGALTGTIQSLVADYPDGTSDRQRYLDVGEPYKRSLHLTFSGEADVSSGDRVRVWGATRGDELVVTRIEKLPALAEDVVVGALSAAAPKMNKNAFILVDVGKGVNVTTAAATTGVFSPGNSFAAVYNALSYGSMIYTGDVVGPFSYPITACSQTEYYTGLRKAVMPMIGAYDHYMWYFGSMVSACGWSGLGVEGTATKPATDAWFNASSSCNVLVQEVGHNNGWMHSSTLSCPGKTFVDDPAAAGCSTSEYGNRYTPMGMGCGHFIAMDKWYGGYFTGCNGVRVASSGTFNLVPLENACDGIQGLQIVMPKTTRGWRAQQDSTATPIKNYYLELRVNGAVSESTNVKAPAVFVNVGNDVPARNLASYHSFLLDMDPSTTNTFDGMTAAGQSFSDPAGGLTFTVMSIDATHATIQVKYDNAGGAAATCIDGTMLAGSGPTECSGESVTGTGGTTGTMGAGGSTGAAGTTGRGGTGGMTGRAGTGGATTSGSAGRGMGGMSATGTTGSAGTSGTDGSSESGIAGTSATAGSNGTNSGAAGTKGTAGIPGTGLPGTTGAAGTTATPGEAPSEVVGGCACAMASEGGTAAPALTCLVLGAALAVTRRRRRR